MIEAPLISNHKEEENIEKINKEVVQEFFTNVYDKRNIDAIDQFVASEFSLFNIMTSRSKLKEDIQKLLDLFPDLKHDMKQIIAEGEYITVFNKWKSSKGILMVASIPRIEKREITKWDEIPFFPKKYNRYLKKNFQNLYKDILHRYKI